MDEQQDGRDPKAPDAGAAPGVDAAGAQTPEERVAALTAERDEMKDRMLRIAAEFENWKRRARKEQDDGEAKVRESVLRDMLDVIDNLERAVGAFGESGTPAPGQPAPDAAAVLKGVALVLRVFQSKLERHNVKPFVSKGEAFDPRLHEAISRVPTADVPAGSVAVELQRGYRIGDKLLRPAMVSVAVAPAASQNAAGDADA
ncbi:MAG TPA: nucleotide exchange factor GrpE [Polyangia bacterium]|nr:nucleotide exchange factor GrpE [Polyangia bacterium]